MKTLIAGKCAQTTTSIRRLYASWKNRWRMWPEPLRNCSIGSSLRRWRWKTAVTSNRKMHQELNLWGLFQLWWMEHEEYSTLFSYLHLFCYNKYSMLILMAEVRKRKKGKYRRMTYLWATGQGFAFFSLLFWLTACIHKNWCKPKWLDDKLVYWAHEYI